MGSPSTSMPTDEELLSLFANQSLGRAMSRRFGLTDDAHLVAVGAACARLHNDGQLDLLAVIQRGEIQQLEGFAFFAAAHMFGQILPHMRTEPGPLMACIESLVAQGGNDLAANEPNRAFRTWCAKNPEKAREIIDSAKAGNALAARNLTFALEALGEIKIAQQLLGEADHGVRLAAVTALGRIEDSELASRQATLDLLAVLSREADETLRLASLQTVGFVLSQDAGGSVADAIELIRHLVEDSTDQTIHAAALALSRYAGMRSPEVSAVLLTTVGKVKAENKGTVDLLDDALVTLLQEEKADIALRFVAELFRGKGDLKLTAFNSFLRELAEGSAHVLGRAVVDWLRSGEFRLCDALSETLRRSGSDAPILNIEDHIRNLPSLEQVFICRKAIGWLFIKPQTAASILVSVLRVCDAGTSVEVQRHLVDPLLLNYGGIREYLQSIGKSDTAKSAVDAALAKNDAYLSALKGFPLIEELRPSEAHQQIQRTRLADQGRDIAKSARKQSVLLNFVKHSVMLFGRRSVSYVQGPGNELRAVETDLHSHQISFEYPRMEIADPVGLDYVLRVLRAESIAR